MTVTSEQIKKHLPYANKDTVSKIQGAGITPEQFDVMARAFPPDFLGLVEAYKLENGCSKTEALKAVARKHPEAHSAYIRRVNNG